MKEIEKAGNLDKEIISQMMKERTLRNERLIEEAKKIREKEDKEQETPVKTTEKVKDQNSKNFEIKKTANENLQKSEKMENNNQNLEGLEKDRL